MNSQGQSSSSRTSYDVTDDDGGVDQATALHSTECYDNYVEFIDKAAAAAYENPGKVTLYIASAPLLDDRLNDIILRLKSHQQKDVQYEQVNFFFRKDRFDRVLKYQEITRNYIVENIPTGILQVYVSSKKKLFHTNRHSAAHAHVCQCDRVPPEHRKRKQHDNQ